MSVSILRLFDQGPVLRTLAGVALADLAPKRGDHAARELPGPWIRATLPPRPDALVRDYIRHTGGDPAWYRGRVPAHLFSQWGFPLAAKAIAGMHYPMARVINAGCRVEMRAPLPAGEPLEVAARLDSVDDNGHRALITTRIVTGTASAPEAVIATLHAFVPLASGRTPHHGTARPDQQEGGKAGRPIGVSTARTDNEASSSSRDENQSQSRIANHHASHDGPGLADPRTFQTSRLPVHPDPEGDVKIGSAPDRQAKPTTKTKSRPTVPADAHEIAFFRVAENAGWEFAKLTGDLNPIHWIKPAAKASGFRSVILHGFATLARAVEAVNRDVLSGDVDALAVVDARFTRPLVLPAKVGVYTTHAGGLYVGDAPGGTAYLEGTFERKHHD